MIKNYRSHHERVKKYRKYKARLKFDIKLKFFDRNQIANVDRKLEKKSLPVLFFFSLKKHSNRQSFLCDKIDFKNKYFNKEENIDIKLENNLCQ